MTRAPRWRTLLGRPDDVLAALVADAALATRTRRAELSRWSAISGLPDGEVLASPFGARMIALGLEAGATTVHHELRPLLPWHRSVRPEGAVTDPKHGLWIRGALRTGKYEEFCAEDPFTSHHPEHSAKWAPHEMLHRAVGFFARADASGFSRYLGARLNELLPVATWYGLELARRLDREGPFDRVREGSEIEAPRERALWLGESERSLRARARRAAPLLRWTLERTDRELAAIDEEIASGRIVASPDVHLESLPDVRLDASADALAYVHAHARRLESPAIAQILDALAPQCVPTVATLRARVDRVLDRLLFGRIALAPAHFEARIRANVVLDVLLRAAITEPSVDLRELVARGRRLVARRLSTGALIRFVEDVRARLEGAVGRQRARAIVTLGLVSRPELTSLDTRALAHGLAQVVPCTARALGPRGRDAVVASLVEQSRRGPGRRGHLALRVREAILALARSQGADPEVVLALSELARLEHLLDAPAVHEPREPWRIPAQGAPPRARVSLRSGLRIERFVHDVLALHRGEAPAPRVVHVAVGHIGGETLLCELPEDIGRALTRAPSGTITALARRIGRAALDELDAIGVLIVLPPG
jgi:hypothetical protein